MQITIYFLTVKNHIEIKPENQRLLVHFYPQLPNKMFFYVSYVLTKQKNNNVR